MNKTKPPYKQKNGNGGLRDLFRELWNSAVTLRGSIAPADYKRYVLPLIFLRFLSLRYEKRLGEIDAEIADPKSDLHTTDKQLALEIREDPDNFKKKNVFLVPEEARWDNIVKIARADDVKIKLDNVLALLEKNLSETPGLAPAHLRRHEPRQGKRRRPHQSFFQGHLSPGNRRRGHAEARL